MAGDGFFLIFRLKILGLARGVWVRFPPPALKIANKYSRESHCLREAIDLTNRTDAAEFLKKRISDALGGKIVLSRNVTYDDPRDLITDYTNNGRKSLGDLKTTRLPWFDAVFGDEGDRGHHHVGRALQDASADCV